MRRVFSRREKQNRVSGRLWRRDYSGAKFQCVWPDCVGLLKAEETMSLILAW